MVKTIYVTGRNYDRALPYWKETIDENLRRKGERSAKAGRDWPYFVRDGIAITINEMARHIDSSRRKAQ